MTTSHCCRAWGDYCDLLAMQVSYFPREAFTKHDDFDKAACILLDIDLGDVSGIEVAQRLKAENVSTPIIFMTGNDHPAVREAAHRSGCLAFLTKPFSAAALAQYLHLARPRPAEGT
jgi:FixJ family two-component response regulator